jgi:hypothetical protein
MATIPQEKIEALLLESLERAIQRQDDARAAYQKLLLDLSRQPACRTQIDHLLNAADNQLEARQEMWKAIARFTDFTRKSIDSAASGSAQFHRETPSAHFQRAASR